MFGAQYWNALQKPCNGLPPTLICMYFLLAWSESFPGTAMMALLNDELHLSPSLITTYWAVAFFPWMWKPLYGWISDTFPIARYHRSPYIGITAAVTALGYILIASVGKNFWSMLVIGTCQAVFTAFSQLMLDAFLVDIARQNLNQAAAYQSVANASKSVGSLVAQVFALVVYARGAGGSLKMDVARLTARQAIAVTSVAPLSMMLMAPCAPETADLGFEGNNSCSETAAVKISGDSLRLAFTVVMVQINLVIVGCESFFSEKAMWLSTLGVSLAVTSLLACLASFIQHARQHRSPHASLGGESKCRWIRTAFFCFLVNAIPTSRASVNLLQFDVIHEDSYQVIGIISSCTSVIAALAFGGCFSKWRVQRAIAASTLISIVAGFSRLPFATLAVDYLRDHEQKSARMLSSLGFWAVSASIFESISTIFAVLPIDTLVTVASGGEMRTKNSTVLAIFLSIYNFGATVASISSASLLQAIGLDGKNWRPLPMWITATACAKLLVLLALPILPALTTSEACTELDPSTVEIPLWNTEEETEDMEAPLL